MESRLIAYYRVSTQKQGQSGLGLEAQRSAVEAYARATGAAVVAGYVEVETAKRQSVANRPELVKALAHAKRAGAALAVAKLDRLSRNVAFLAALMESGAGFVACDNPHATRLTLHVLAAVAEDEARRTSERTKAALAAYKARGGVLGGRRPGSPPITLDAARRGGRLSAEARRSAAAAANAEAAATALGLLGSRLSYRAAAAELNARGVPTPKGGPWSAGQVHRVARLYGGAGGPVR